MDSQYPEIPDFSKLGCLVKHYARLKHEMGSKEVASIVGSLEELFKSKLEELKELPVDPVLARKNPAGLDSIRSLRPDGPRRFSLVLDPADYRDRLAGSLMSRFAGCTLGAPVEFWSVERMENLARENGDPFPPVDYWKRVPDPFLLRYKVTPRMAYTRANIDGVPVDDDITYTLLGLIMMERFGPGITTAEIGEAWLDWLPYACTAEEVALENLRKGIPAEEVAEYDNPYREWIGGDIRSDPWGYIAPGWPEKAAELAYRDASLTHRGQGLYGTMFFSAVISAAFVVDNPREAIQIGLTEIPKDCALGKAVSWALEKAPEIQDYKQARSAVDEKFPGMDHVHTINNACLSIFGLLLGSPDITRIISETVAMGYDNDCTAATAGSIAGALVGLKNVPEHWYLPFGDTIHTYLTGHEQFGIQDVLDRFTKQMLRITSG